MSVTSLTDRLLSDSQRNGAYIKGRLAKVAKDGRGGRRDGAGRPLGAKGKRTDEALALAQEMKADPVKFLLLAMSDENLNMKDRIECAKAVAPYIAPRLSAVESRVTNVKSHEEMLSELDE